MKKNLMTEYFLYTWIIWFYDDFQYFINKTYKSWQHFLIFKLNIWKIVFSISSNILTILKSFTYLTHFECSLYFYCRMHRLICTSDLTKYYVFFLLLNNKHSFIALLYSNTYINQFTASNHIIIKYYCLHYIWPSK